jgi:hypothetical protein
MSEKLERQPEGGPDEPSPSRGFNVAASPDARIEDYLDHVCAPLVGVVPYARRQ